MNEKAVRNRPQKHKSRVQLSLDGVDVPVAMTHAQEQRLRLTLAPYMAKVGAAQGLGGHGWNVVSVRCERAFSTQRGSRG